MLLFLKVLALIVLAAVVNGKDHMFNQLSTCISVTELKEKAAEKARVLAEKKKQLENSNSATKQAENVVNGVPELKKQSLIAQKKQLENEIAMK